MAFEYFSVYTAPHPVTKLSVFQVMAGKNKI